MFAYIDTQIKQTEQGTMSVETAFCTQLVSFSVLPRFTCVPFWFLDTSVDIDTEIEQSEQGTVIIEATFCINAT